MRGDAQTAEPATSVDLVRHGVPHGRAALVDDQAELLRLVDHLRKAGRFAFDTEFIGELSYEPKLCLVQVATPTRVALIDPLAGLELGAFWDLLCDPALEKIVHAGEQDLQHIWRWAGRAPANVLDTQVAAGFVALGYPAALAKLVLEVIGVRLAKGFTFTDWTQRPLSESQLKYAADDVRFLPVLADRVIQLLARRARLDWARQECARRCLECRPESDPRDGWVRVRGGGSLDPSGINVLRELVAWRDAAAREADLPPRSFVKDEVLVEIARHPPRSAERLFHIRHMPRPVVDHHGPAILQAAALGLNMPVSGGHPPPPVEQLLSEKFRYDLIWAQAECHCYQQGLDPMLVSSRQEIIDLDRVLRTTEGTGTPLLTGWRRQALGEKLLEMLRTPVTPV